MEMTLEYLKLNPIDYEDKNEIKDMIFDYSKFYLKKRRLLKNKENVRQLLYKTFFSII